MEDKPRIVIAGGSGFIGHALSRFLSRRNFEVVVLTRGENETRGDSRYVNWNGKTVGAWARELDGATAVINLAGRSINCRFTERNRSEILDSRVDSTRTLANAIAGITTPPPVLVQASGIGYYRSSGENVVDESTPGGGDFMAEVCQQWEGAIDAFAFPATRKVILRIGIVLGPGGGALLVLERLTKAFLGGAAGSGRQFVSWIHMHDVIRMVLAMIERHDLAG
ncbi:MAG TPA: TIGR01777 family oxidoreductase, partial [Chthoniobacterales bacterium]|nr:TIGR01777 family oxidoreductase [Chthoniobacterales bacterium]